MMTQNYIKSSFCQEDTTFEAPLRPPTLADFIGQDPIRERLEVMIGAAKQRGEALGHCLFSGPPGLGKTTLANILAKAMGTNIIVTSGPLIEKAGDLAGVLTNLKEGDILFIDELHRLPPATEEYLYPPMEDFVLDLMIDKGPNARSIQLKLPRFTLVGATTRVGLLTSPLRSRFAFSCRLDYYEPKVLEQILGRTAQILHMTIDQEGLAEIANRSRGTPRIANHLLRWVRDYAQMRANNCVTLPIVAKALDMLAIDQIGFDEMDKRILEVLIDHYDGGPVGLNTLAVAIGEEKNTIEEVHEPYLIMKGFIKRTPKGRVATESAYKHLGKLKKRRTKN
ncbi:Holliday junction branch migration DNA helicase RuvB [Parachlamydia sp. AcF125]|uniref:Holliday junction branch migration DNA helicase RuvB n=1 Tax=Parachlamydia sp. AcF125 TaxID=2795736 RepID=UPI001BCA1B04|nr:Holliday junction branch migration DNA helicase RuvB [Parachlamydia sp. AcF125]MBS4168277.1 Holliday junction ATP-dependent DNA helicase RuvB [Parachlamydia sp. AcF125]